MDFRERTGVKTMREMEYLEELTGRYPVLHAVKADVLAVMNMGERSSLQETAEAALTVSTSWGS